jgi:uncharacterized RDD family membrane protein YckC
MSGLVSGEAVVLELRPARVASRGIGFCLDAVVQLVLLLVLVLGAGLVTEAFGGDEALAAATSLVAVVTALVGYPLVLETLTRGRTLGKWALGLRVVREDGSAVRFRHSLIRSLFAVVELWATTGAIALIASLLSKDGKRLGDQFAGTIVVRERGPRSQDITWTMPPRMAGWAADADLSRVPDELALTIRTFLLRVGQLEPSARWRTGVELADRAAAVVAPPPPNGVHPEEFLVAVLAGRRLRATVPAPALTGGPTPVPGASSPTPMPTPTPGQIGAPPVIARPPAAAPSAAPATPPTDGFAPPG